MENDTDNEMVFILYRVYSISLGARIFGFDAVRFLPKVDSGNAARLRQHKVYLLVLSRDREYGKILYREKIGIAFPYTLLRTSKFRFYFQGLGCNARE